MNKKNIGLLVVGWVLIIIIVFAISVTKNEPNQVLSDKVKVTTSFYPLYFFASEIGGDKADVRNITPAGAEPHEYEPTAQDIVSIEGSALLVLNGGGLEPWGEDIRKNINLNKTLIVTAGVGLTTQSVVEDGEKIVDPHVWLSPALAKQMVEKIVAGFMVVDEENGSYYVSRADVLSTKLDDLDRKYKEGLSMCSKNDIITSHAAFGYLATTYKLKQVAITGISPDAEPTPQELKEVADFAKKNNVKYIFFESLLSPKLAETIAREVGAQTLVLNPLEGLTKEEISEGKSYLTEMESNLVNLKIALECK